MESGENNQLELFSQSANKSSARMGRPNISFLANIRQYEKIILIIIAIIIVGIISFSLGVEKGKRVIPKVYQEHSAKISQVADKPQDSTLPPTVQESSGGFTIQVASFKSKTLAQREAQDIKKRGLNPIILSKGVYTVVCIGNFVDKKDAQAAISELKKRYQGCFMRRL
jgi:hypothetical protein